MNNASPFSYYEQRFSPIVGIFYDVFLEGITNPLRVEFTNERIYNEEIIIGFDVYECWDDEETRYVYYCDEYGYRELRTETIDGTMIKLLVNEIVKCDNTDDKNNSQHPSKTYSKYSSSLNSLVQSK